MASDGDLAAITHHDHKAIARASHNALFVQIISSFARIIQVAV
jgi:DNA-binding FadR family transcriptional regulator